MAPRRSRSKKAVTTKRVKKTAGKAAKTKTARKKTTRKAAKKAARKTLKKKVAKKTSTRKKAAAASRRRAKSKPSPRARKAGKRTAAGLPRGSATFNTVLATGLEFDRLRITGTGANRRLLDQILGRHVPDSTPLDPPYDGPARAGLAARIQRAGVPVSSAAVIACETVGCVHNEMNRVNPAGR